MGFRGRSCVGGFGFEVVEAEECVELVGELGEEGREGCGLLAFLVFVVYVGCGHVGGFMGVDGCGFVGRGGEVGKAVGRYLGAEGGGIPALCGGGGERGAVVFGQFVGEAEREYFLGIEPKALRHDGVELLGRLRAAGGVDARHGAVYLVEVELGVLEVVDGAGDFLGVLVTPLHIDGEGVEVGEVEGVAAHEHTLGTGGQDGGGRGHEAVQVAGDAAVVDEETAYLQRVNQGASERGHVDVHVLPLELAEFAPYIFVRDGPADVGVDIDVVFHAVVFFFGEFRRFGQMRKRQNEGYCLRRPCR